MRVKPHDRSFKAFNKAEEETPVPRKVYEDRIIKESQDIFLSETNGHPVLCDLGEARLGGGTYDDPIQPDVYRVPEVTLDIPWTFSVEIWNFALVAWAIVEDDLLFHGRDEDGE